MKSHFTEEDRARRREYMRVYRTENREKTLASVRDYKARNQASVKEYARSYVARKKDEIAARKKNKKEIYRQSAKERILAEATSFLPVTSFLLP
jgi:hypothetical protein